MGSEPVACETCMIDILAVAVNIRTCGIVILNPCLTPFRTAVTRLIVERRCDTIRAVVRYVVVLDAAADQ